MQRDTGQINKKGHGGQFFISPGGVIIKKMRARAAYSLRT